MTDTAAALPEPLVLVPGMGADARFFWHQIVALAPSRAVQIALPVAGATVEEMARAVLAGAPGRFALAGHGLGGNVALEMLRRAPERISRIALMSLSAQAEMPQIAAAREARIVGALAGRLADVVIEEVRAAGLAPGTGRAAVLALAAEMATDLGDPVYVAQCRALQRRPDQQKTLRQALLPALVLCGGLDVANPPRRHEFIAQLMPYGRWHCLPEAGAMLPLEDPVQVTDCLRKWLGEPLRLRPG